MLYFLKFLWHAPKYPCVASRLIIIFAEHLYYLRNFKLLATNVNENNNRETSRRKERKTLSRQFHSVSFNLIIIHLKTLFIRATIINAKNTQPQPNEKNYLKMLCCERYIKNIIFFLHFTFTSTHSTRNETKK